MILITEFMDENAVAVLQKRYQVFYEPDLADKQDKLPGRMQGIQALIVRNRTQVTDMLLASAPDLECVGRLGVGLDNIDVGACKKRGITVYPASGANNLSVAEYVMTAAMMLLRRAWFANATMLEGRWPRQACAGQETAGKVLGLIGFGAIARETSRLASGLRMTICYSDPFVPQNGAVDSGVQEVGFNELLASADVISLHVPLTDQTRHMIAAREIAQMKPGAILVNAARGGVVDEAAVCSALLSGQLGGAALDVFETEPLTADAAEIFANVPNLILTPHIAGVTAESNVRVSQMIADAVINHLSQRI